MIGIIRSQPTRWLDSAEKYILCSIFAVFSYRMVLGYQATGSLVTLVYLFDQMLVLIFILFRRRTDDISCRPDDWLVGFAGTFFALLYGASSGNPLIPNILVMLLLVTGLVIHLSAKLTLRRSFGVVAANRGIKSSGPYRFVRHPMYTGYMVSQAGLYLSGPTLNNTVVLCICWALFLGRIRAEERVLGADPTYAKLAPYKLIPGLY